MLLQGNQGSTGKAVGQGQVVGLGEFSEQLVTELQARYYENTYRGNTFTASNAAAAVFSAVSTTATGFILSNPAGSGKNLVLIDIAFQYTVATAAAAQALLYANINPVAVAVVHTTPLTVVNTLLGSANTSVAKVDSAATLPAAPTAVRVIQAAATTGPAAVALPYVKDEVAGVIVITQGCAVSIQGTAAIAGAVASMTWVEVAI
jgi:hypothetical protein